MTPGPRPPRRPTRPAHRADGTAPRLQGRLQDGAPASPRAPIRLRATRTGAPRAPIGTAFGGVRRSSRGHLWEGMCSRSCCVGDRGVACRQRTGVEGLLPLLHLGPRFTFQPARTGCARRARGLPRHLRLHASTRRTGSPCRPSSGLRSPTAWSSPRASSRASRSGPRPPTTPTRSPRCRGCTPSPPRPRSSSASSPPTRTTPSSTARAASCSPASCSTTAAWARRSW